MKLIYIVNARMPTEKAHGYQISKMCEEFSRSGAEVELWLPTRKNHIKQDLFSFYDLEDNFKVRYIYSFDFVPYYRYLFGLSIYLQSFFFLIRLVFTKPSKRAFIYSRNSEIAWLFNKRKYQTICEVHRWPSKKNNWFKFFLKGSKIIVVTNYLRKLLIKNNFKGDYISVCPDGVDLDKFDLSIEKDEARERINLPQGKRIIGYTGSFKTMGKEKGLDDVLLALEILRNKQETNNILFVAVGGSQQEAYNYQQKAAELGVKELVEFRERISLDKLALFQKAVDSLVMPFPSSNHYSYYMSPLKMFEYMASKRPIIVSNLPSIREVLDENTAILVRSSDPESLAKGIEKALNSPDLCDKISQQAYQKVKNYSWHRRANKILSFISL